MKVTVSEPNGNLRIRWTYRGMPKTLCLGLKGNKQNRALAQQIADRIKGDLLLGQYDESLERYRPWLLGHNPRILKAPELFTKFMAERTEGLSPGAIARYRSALAHLSRHLYIDAPAVTESKAQNLSAIIAETAGNRTRKEYFMLYRACFEWARGKYEIPNVNPFELAYSKIGSPQKKKTEPFTKSEIRLVLETIRRNQTYAFYYDFTAFLFGIGCRPGEAIALTWEDFSEDFSRVHIGKNYSQGRLRNTTKNETWRDVDLPPSVVEMIRKRYEEMKPKDKDLVFPAKKKGYIDFRMYRQRCWKKILDECDLKYRKPYVMRHTCISLALEAGMDPAHIAKQTGHDLKTLLTHYAHAIGRKVVFVEVL